MKEVAVIFGDSCWIFRLVTAYNCDFYLFRRIWERQNKVTVPNSLSFNSLEFRVWDMGLPLKVFWERYFRDQDFMTESKKGGLLYYEQLLVCSVWNFWADFMECARLLSTQRTEEEGLEKEGGVESIYPLARASLLKEHLLRITCLAFPGHVCWMQSGFEWLPQAAVPGGTSEHIRGTLCRPGWHTLSDYTSTGMTKV